MEVDSRAFARNAQKALADKALQEALADAVRRAEGRRAAAVASFPGFGAARERASAIRRETLSRLDAHLSRFVDEAERRGAVVHVARDAARARAAVARIAREEGVSLAVRSKSTAAEEISLSDAFREAEVEETETDLGGYIARLAGEPPSHILSSAFHMTREGISRLFERTLGEPPAEGIPELSAIARKRLGESFSAAGMGVSGANFLVAETGSVVLLSNDGNARAGALLPRVHLVVAGIEKVVPGTADLPVLLRVLSRSASGQPLPSYVSILTGPRRDGDAEGPGRLHIVLIDNGRSAVLEGKYRDALKCIRCGACLAACPVYRFVGGRPYGWVYPGPIGSVLTPLLAGLAEAAPLPDACALCGACAEACPVKVPLPDLLLELRADVREQGLKTPVEILRAKAYASIMKRAGLLELLERLVGEISRLVSRGNPLGGMPYPFAGWTERRDFPAAARRPFRKLWKIRRGTRE
jgi:L-lactate dehydrogenase complex protein LldF